MANNIPRFLRYIFPASVGTEIAQLQTAVGPTSMVLNGSYADPTGVNPAIDIINHGFSSTISLASTQDSSTTNFTINGYQNGMAISDTIAGPNNNIVPSGQVFDSITSIVTDDPFTDVSVGIANTAFFNLITMDANALIPVYSTEMYWGQGVTATGHGYVTIDHIINNGFTYQQLVTAIPNGPLFELTNNGNPVGDFTNPQFFSQLGQLQSFLFRVIRTTNDPITLVFRGSS